MISAGCDRTSVKNLMAITGTNVSVIIVNLSHQCVCVIAPTQSKEELQIWIRLAVFKVTGIQPRTVVVLDILQVVKFIKIREGIKKLDILRSGWP